jgi:hypothetical protein
VVQKCSNTFLVLDLDFLGKNQTPVVGIKCEKFAGAMLFHRFPYNKNLMRALNTTSLKCCLPSADAINRQEKNLHIHMKVQGRLMEVRFFKIHQVFAKK